MVDDTSSWSLAELLLDLVINTRDISKSYRCTGVAGDDSEGNESGRAGGASGSLTRFLASRLRLAAGLHILLSKSHGVSTLRRDSQYPFRIYSQLPIATHTLQPGSFPISQRSASSAPAGVHEVYVANSNNRYVYKEVENPIHQPRASQVLNQELLNLELFHGTKG